MRSATPTLASPALPPRSTSSFTLAKLMRMMAQKIYPTIQEAAHPRADCAIPAGGCPQCRTVTDQIVGDAITIMSESLGVARGQGEAA